MTISPDVLPHAYPEARPLRVLIVDDAPSTRRMLLAVLDTVDELAVVGEAIDGAAAVAAASALQPDVVLLDLSLPDGDGADVLPRLLAAAPGAQIVVLSNSAYLAGRKLVSAGAAGFISKGLAPKFLIEQLSRTLGVPLSGGPEPELPTEPAATPEMVEETVAEALARRVVAEHTRVLVLEGDPLRRRKINALLVSAGARMISEIVAVDTTVADLCSALDLTRPSLVILGDVAGAMDGDVVARTRDAAPDASVIVYTSRQSFGEKDDTEKVCHVAQPDLERLAQCIEEALAAEPT